MLTACQATALYCNVVCQMFVVAAVLPGLLCNADSVANASIPGACCIIPLELMTHSSDMIVMLQCGVCAGTSQA